MAAGWIRAIQPVYGEQSGSDPRAMHEFRRDMQIAKLSPVTIDDRLAIVERLRVFLDGKPLLEADQDDLRRFQATFAHRSPATVDVYTRHVQALYRWATKRRLIPFDPAEDLIRPRLPRRRPHPMLPDELRMILATARGAMRVAFVLGAFTGLRRGEICRLQRADLDAGTGLWTALIHGKGGHERIVPLLPPVVEELTHYGLPRAGHVVRKKGGAYDPEQMSVDVYQFLRGIGIETTLHSARHFFCTYTARITKDPMFVRDLAGHTTVLTTEPYMESDMSLAHQRLAEFAAMAGELLGPRGRLRIIPGGS